MFGGQGVGAGGDAGAANGPAVAVGSVAGLFERVDDAAEGVVFLCAPGQPHVVRAHLLPGAGRERLAAFVDELQCVVLLGSQLGQEAGVGGELVAGQAGVALVAGLPGRQQTPPIGQDPVGALVELEHVVEVTGVDRQVAAVRGDLAVAQKLPFVRLGEGFGVFHGHRRADVAHVPLHDV